MARKKQMNESQELITLALIRLLNEKSLTSINLTELANEANVVRMTLYNLFLFRFSILKGSPFTNMLYECNQLDKLLSILRTHVMNNLQLFSDVTSDPFLLNFFIGGIDKVTEILIDEGMQIPPDEMAKRVYKLAININNVMNESQ